MQTLTITKGRQSLGELVSKALKGEDIGLVDSRTGRIVALRPVEVYSTDYALMEYGLNEKELDRAAKKVDAEIKRARKKGTLRKFV